MIRGSSPKRQIWKETPSAGHRDPVLLCFLPTLVSPSFRTHLEEEQKKRLGWGQAEMTILVVADQMRRGDRAESPVVLCLAAGWAPSPV